MATVRRSGWLVDTISVPEVCAKLNVQRWMLGDENASPVSIVESETMLSLLSWS
jgi:hypothetical protein